LLIVYCLLQISIVYIIIIYLVIVYLVIVYIVYHYCFECLQSKPKDKTVGY